MRLIFNKKVHFQKDVDKIIAVCKERGYDISAGDALAAWEEYSDSLCASWLSFPEQGDDEIFRIIYDFCKVVP